MNQQANHLAINRHDAAALAVGFVKSRQLPYRLALGVDRLAPTCWVLAPVGDQAPAQRVDDPPTHGTDIVIH
jgi:hypothetical protein